MKKSPTGNGEGALYERLREASVSRLAKGELLNEAADVLEAISEWAESDPEGESDTDELKANWHGYHTAQEEVLHILEGKS